MAHPLVVRKGLQIITTPGSGTGNSVLTLDTTTKNVNLIPPIDLSAYLASALTSGYIFVGNGSNIATGVLMTGAVNISTGGVTTLGTGVVNNSNVSSSASIAVSKLAAGSNNQILITVAGVPTWTTSPLGSPFSTTVAGYVNASGDPTQFLRGDNTFQTIVTTLNNGNGTTWSVGSTAVDLGGILTADVNIDGQFNLTVGSSDQLTDFFVRVTDSAGPHLNQMELFPGGFNVQANNNSIDISSGFTLNVNGIDRLNITSAGLWNLTFGSDAPGDLHYRNSSAHFVRLGIGAANSILGANSLANAPEYKVVSSGLTAGPGTLRLGGALTMNAQFDGNWGWYMGVATPLGSFEVHAGQFFLGVDAGPNISMTSSAIALTSGGGTNTFSITLGSDATGDIYYRNSGGFFTRLPVSTDGKVLTLASGLPSWATASGGGSALTPTAVKTANYTATVSDFIPSDASGGSFTVTLPTTPADKSIIAVKLIAVASTNTVTIAAGGSDVFNKTAGSTSLTLSLLNQVVTLQYKSSTGIWYVTSTDPGLGTWPGSTNVVTLGTITTGTWNATVVAGQYGGTGVANTGKTITLGGNLTTSGAFNTTFTVTGSNTITFPNAAITVARIDAAQTFTGVQTFSSVPVFSAGIGSATATTQSAGDNSTKVATTAYVDGLALTIPITPANGGTGVINNAASTITITGSFGTTFVVTGSNSITFPNASITVARIDAAQTFTGVQTFSSVPVFSAGIAGTTATTQAPGDNTTAVATTAFVTAAVTGASGWQVTGTSTFTGAVLIDQTTTGANTLKFKAASLGVTAVDGKGLWLYNDTAAAAGAQQISPSLVLEGQGWKTTATAASQSVKWRFDVLPVQGSAAPAAQLRLSASINGGAYTTPLNLTDDGTLTFTGAGQILFTANNAILQTSSSSGLVRLICGAGGFIRFEAPSTGVNGAIDVITSNTTFSQTTGTGVQMQLNKTFAVSSGTASFTQLQLIPVWNTTSTYSGTGIGIDYNPTLTSATGLTHIAARFTSGQVRIAGNTYIGSTGTSPTGLLHIAGGTTSAPAIQLTNGSLLTSKVIGAIELSNSLYYTLPNSTQRTGVGGKIFDHYTDVGTPASTAETDLYTDTLPASLFFNSGDTVEATYALKAVSAGGTTKRVRVYFAGSVIYDTSTASIIANTDIAVYVCLVAVGSTEVRATVSIVTSTSAIGSSVTVTKLTGLTLGGTNILKITGQSGAGAAANDIVAYSGIVEYLPLAA